MKKLPAEKPALDISLAVLHEESQNWISELDFWKDETKFFTNLLKKQHIKAIMEGKSEIYNELIAKVTILNDPKISDLKAEITKHEKILAKLLKNSDATDEQTYREQHTIIAEKISKMNFEFKQIKKDLFIIAEDWP